MANETNILTDEDLLKSLKKNVTDEDMNILRAKFEEKDQAIFDLKQSHKNLQNINKKLIEAEKAKMTFLSNLKNEINNPLASLIALGEEIESMEEGSDERKQYKEISDIVLRDVLSLDFQMKNLMAAAELESGDVELQLVKASVNTIIETAIKNLGPLVTEKNVSFTVKGDDPLWINSDTEKLYIVIINLLSNAVIFNKDGGDVKVEIGVEGKDFVCAITDEGIGIDTKDLKDIFNSFVQLDTGLTKQYRGHGIGLSVTRDFAELLGGEVAVESKVGVGSTFTLRVPARLDEEVSSTFVDGVELFGDDTEGETF